MAAPVTVMELSHLAYGLWTVKKSHKLNICPGG